MANRLAALTSLVTLLATAVLFGATPLLAQDAGSERIVLRAQPSSFSSCSRESCNREPLTPAEGREAQVLIVERDGKYYWASREERQLYHTRSGIYRLFIDLRGGGYVKVDGTSGEYYEHLPVLLGPITYWGQAEHFEP